MRPSPRSSFPGVSRRAFLARGAAFAAGAVILPKLAFAAPSRGSAPSLVRRVVAGPESTYFAYTHANAFLPDGRTHVVARGENGGISFIAFDPQSGRERALGFLKGVDLYYSLSDDGRTLAETDGRRLLAWELGSKNEPRVLFRDPEGEEGKWAINVSDISADGRSFVAMRRFRGTKPYKVLPDGRGLQYQLLTHDLRSGRSEFAMEADWWINHVHFSPHDPAWISMAHEGDADKIPDRLWAWHAKDAPDGRMIFNQTGPDGLPLYVGHERAMFDKPACVCIAYGASPSAATGLYEIGFDGKSSRLVSASDRDWHCNISRDGKWAVVDTTGPHDAPGRGWEDAGRVSDVLAVNMRTGARAFLHRSSQSKHPYHPHPHISPDGRWVVFNDSDSRRTMALEIDPSALKSFLEA